ncbi:hypothetical protein ACWKSP_26680 [Micromonosporaceae bacterium Da 78-11]
MTDFQDTHPYRYRVWFTYPTAAGDVESQKEMAFIGPRDQDDIQALDTDITVTRVEAF